MEESNQKASTKPKPKRSKAAAKKSTALDLPVIPMKDMVVFPRMLLPLFIARPGSVRALEEALESHNQVALICQKTDHHAYPKPADLPEIGISAQILQTVRMPDGVSKIMVECRERIMVQKYSRKRDYLRAKFEVLEEIPVRVGPKEKVLVQLMQKQFEHFMQMSQQQLPDMVEQVPTVNEPGALADMIAAYIQGESSEKQSILENLSPISRLEQVGKLLSKSLELVAIENQIHNKLRQSVDKNQKEFFLREKLRLIQEELGEENDGEDGDYESKIKAIEIEEVRTKALKELRRLDKMPPVSSEAAVIQNYLDLVVDLPWTEKPATPVSVAEARRILDKEHFGLEKVKERVLEYLAVQKLTGGNPKTLLCMVGPPGVGKTSLSQSIAHATGRKFERIALGGVGDDAEIRGHRRTYVGALPGRIIQAIRRAGTSHLVILLDEVDKMTKRMHGDPTAALLEVLDPAQNHAFKDHFLDLPFDLSNVLFLCAANTTSTLPRPFLDRLQILQLHSYTQEEKITIAREYLLPRQKKDNGIAKERITLTKKALSILIERYTREAGVRELERKLGHVCRKIACAIVEEQPYPKRLDSLKQLTQLLGPPDYTAKTLTEDPEVGLVNGLAWTEVGGSILQIEVGVSPGQGKLITTGHLGDVMKESMQMALGYVRQNTDTYKISPARLKKMDIHIHVPEGATPKDGPSAGIAITTALISVLTQRPVSSKVAMTGEMTLRGRVLAIGGLREKALAAFRKGIPTVIMPKDNLSALDDMPQELKDAVTFKPVSSIQEVLELALLPQ